MMGASETEPQVSDRHIDHSEDEGSHCEADPCCGKKEGGDCKKMASSRDIAPRDGCCGGGDCEKPAPAVSADAPKPSQAIDDKIEKNTQAHPGQSLAHRTTSRQGRASDEEEDYEGMPELEYNPRTAQNTREAPRTAAAAPSPVADAVDDDIEEIPRPDLAPLPQKRPSKWSLLNDDGLRQRGGGDGCCSGGGCGPRTYVDETEEDVKDSNRRAWLSFFLLLLMVLPAIPLALVGWDYFINSSLAMQMGLTMTPKQRLEAFYREHNPYKLNEYTIETTLRKWEGRYDQLFKALEKKYSKKKRRSAKA